MARSKWHARDARYALLERVAAAIEHSAALAMQHAEREDRVHRCVRHAPQLSPATQIRPSSGSAQR